MNDSAGRLGQALDALESRAAELRAMGVHSVLATFTDLAGTPKGKLVPLEGLADAVAVGAGFAGPSIVGTGLPRMGPRSEYFGRVLPETLRPLPFMPGVAHAVCEGFAGGQPLDTDPRGALQRQVARLRERGWTLWVGIEPEFFLLKRGADGRWGVADARDTLAKPSYDLRAIGRQRGFLDDMRQALTALGFELQQMDHEDAAGQYEINYRHDEALAAADRYQLFKLTAQAVAERHGCVFSTMPKPLAGAPGSGLHFHLSLTDDGMSCGAGQQPGAGRPLMADGAGALGLSETGWRFAAGLLRHADGLAALCAPTVNSYKRLAASRSASGTTWSPVWKAIGDNNRSCLLRAVAGRLEWRLPDPSCNVYLALAATLAAGLDGIDQGLVAPRPCRDDLYERHARGEPMPDRLPRDLHDALLALEGDAALRAALGEPLVAQVLSLQRAEWAAYHAQVSDWELERYAEG
ncbi:MAG: type III glutamate--ammonia ligase [Comamonadaceae bacterium]|uniref:Type III glutamate--ammonia ligase n=1 Tax=Hydrogenophaga borbori TaxID=2294117 RepID=A0A372EJL6_9BURK|nr:type III glutamate--ammonia ligase [Hydrogenophaga borbori]NCT98235.1 type III glutamate--ammonia ligase [Comamonadaceae bacterium]RFP78728.1 type III glutamate--ammonia ligase [Hydrogenophaga borbori]